MYCQIKNKKGIQVVVGISSVSVSDHTGDYETGDVSVPTDSSVQSPEDHYWTGSTSDGAVDGDILRNYKTRKISEIENKTSVLTEREVFVYDSKSFRISPDVERMAVLYMGYVSSGGDITGKQVPDVDGIAYSFVNNAGLHAWYVTGFDAFMLIFGPHATLITSVLAADNTQAAMDAIVDNR